MVADPKKHAITAPPPLPLPESQLPDSPAAFDNTVSPKRPTRKRSSPLKALHPSHERKRRITSGATAENADAMNADAAHVR